MGTYLSEREREQLRPAETAAFESPVPTQMISNGEFNPLPQTPQQRRLEARITELADTNGRRLGMDRRGFLRTACGLATAFVAMNDVFGPMFDIDRAEAAQPDAAAARASSLSKQFVFDDQLHFVRDDYKWEGIADLAKYAAAHWNPAMKNDAVGLGVNRYKFDNFLKEVYFDSDTRVGLLSGAPFDDPNNWFLSNDQINRPPTPSTRSPDGNACCIIRWSRRSSRVGSTKWIAASRWCIRPVGRATRSAIRCRPRPRNIHGASIMRS